jgi:hypothetical protein
MSMDATHSKLMDEIDTMRVSLRRTNSAVRFHINSKSSAAGFAATPDRAVREGVRIAANAFLLASKGMGSQRRDSDRPSALAPFGL